LQKHNIRFSSETQGIAKFVSSFSSLLSPQARRKHGQLQIPYFKLTNSFSQYYTEVDHAFYIYSDTKQLQSIK
jgi:hypothetical protein